MRHMQHTNYFRFLFFTLFVGAIGISATAQTERQINNEYREMIMNYIRQDVASRSKAMSKEAEQILINLPNDEKLYDETFIDLKADVVEGQDEDGNNELNFVYDLSYNCRHIEGVTDDYPEGSYAWNKSNSCRAICDLTKTLLDGRCSDFFKKGKRVTIKIFTSTDAKEISHINYGGEYGDFKYCPAIYNDENVRISVAQATGISTNAQLAYLRGQSVKSYLESNLNGISGTKNKFEFITKTASNQGSFYRRSSIQIIVHNAFDEVIKEMTEKLEDDDYIDINIPTVDPNSNNNTFVLIIANEQYTNPFPKVDYAANDGGTFQQYCIKTLGVPERHVKILNNVGRQEIKSLGINWLKDITVAVKGQANVIVYYAGHAITDADYNPYIIPNGINTKSIRGIADKMGTEIDLSKKETKKFLAQCLSLDTLCTWFNRVQNQGITFIMDASFDGSQRNGKPLLSIAKSSKKMRGMRIRNDITIFTAAAFNKPAYTYDDQKHGFLTYFMLKELRHNKGNMTYESLFKNINKSISYESSLQGKLQEPAITVGGKIKESWGEKSFK